MYVVPHGELSVLAGRLARLQMPVPWPDTQSTNQICNLPPSPSASFRPFATPSHPAQRSIAARTAARERVCVRRELMLHGRRTPLLLLARVPSTFVRRSDLHVDAPRCTASEAQTGRPRATDRQTYSTPCHTAKAASRAGTPVADGRSAIRSSLVDCGGGDGALTSLKG